MMTIKRILVISVATVYTLSMHRNVLVKIDIVTVNILFIKYVITVPEQLN